MFTKSGRKGKWALKSMPQIRLIVGAVPRGKVMAGGQISKFGGSSDIKPASNEVSE